jgi:hypothetical protein
VSASSRWRLRRLQRLLPWILVLLVTAAMTSIIVNVIATWSEESQTGNPIIVTVPATQGENDLRIQAFLSSDKIPPGDQVTLWIMVQNGGKDPIRDVTLVNWIAPGFEPETFIPRYTPILAPNRSEVFRPEGTLRAGVESKKFRATAEFTWIDNNTERRKAVIIGPITVRRDLPPFFTFNRRVVGLIKELLLPLVAALLTYWFTQRQRQTEFDRAAWNVMWTKAHENVERYYAPLAEAAGNAARRLPTIDLSNPDSVDQALFFLLLWMRRTRLLFQKIGAYYLASRHGETIVAKCADLAIGGINGAIGLNARSAAVMTLAPFTDYHQFRTGGLSNDEVKPLRDQLVLWANDPSRKALREISALLHVYVAALGNEINVPYNFWYPEALGPLPPLTDEVAALAANPKLKQIATNYEEYLRFSREVWYYA